MCKDCLNEMMKKVVTPKSRIMKRRKNFMGCSESKVPVEEDLERWNSVVSEIVGS